MFDVGSALSGMRQMMASKFAQEAGDVGADAGPAAASEGAAPASTAPADSASVDAVSRFMAYAMPAVDAGLPAAAAISRPAITTPLTAPANLPGPSAAAGTATASAPALTDPAQKQAYAALTPEQQSSFDTVYSAVGTDPKTAGDLQSLLSSGELAKPDSKGVSMIDNLRGSVQAAQRNPQLGGNVDSMSVVRSLVDNVAHPENAKQTEDSSTCASAALENALTVEAPGELVRMATDLITSGETTFTNGKQMSLDTSGVKNSDHSSDVFSQVFQGSLTNYAASHYAATGPDEFGRGRAGFTVTFGRGKAGYFGRFGGDSTDGLTPNQIKGMYQDVLNSAARQISKTPENQEDLMSGIQQATADGHPVPVGVRNTEGGGHEVLVTKVDDNNVYVSDSTDYNDPSNVRKVPIQDFEKQMLTATLPMKYSYGIDDPSTERAANGMYL